MTQETPTAGKIIELLLVDSPANQARLLAGNSGHRDFPRGGLTMENMFERSPAGNVSIAFGRNANLQA